VQDVAADGTALITMNERRILMHAFSQGRWRDLSWLDRSIFDRISADGSLVLFHEGGQGGGPLGTTYVRNPDGSPAVRLSDGYAIDLSPDKKWVLVWLPRVPAQYRLVPTGAGDPKPVATPDIGTVRPLGFARDRQALIWLGSTHDDRTQTFATDLDGTNPRPVGPPGTFPIAVSPNGQYDLRVTPAGLVVRNTLRDSSEPVSHRERNDRVFFVSDDGQWVYLWRMTAPGNLKILHLDLRTGARQVVTEIPVNDMTGVASLIGMAITPDGKSIVIGYVRHLSELYMMQKRK
jgi:hypothetical protein